MTLQVFAFRGFGESDLNTCKNKLHRKSQDRLMIRIPVFLPGAQCFFSFYFLKIVFGQFVPLFNNGERQEMREKRVRECHAANDPAGTRCSGHLPSCDMCPNLLNSAVRSHQPNVSVSAFHVLLSPLSDTQTCISLWLNSNTNITLLERKMLTYDCWTEQNHYSYQH